MLMYSNARDLNEFRSSKLQNCYSTLLEIIRICEYFSHKMTETSVSSQLLQFSPHSIDLVSEEEAESLLFDTTSMEELPPLQDTVLGRSNAEFGILLIHGFSGSNRELLYLGNYLAKDGYRVAIPVLPGHGTNADDLAKTDHNDWFLKVKEAYNFLSSEVDEREIIVAGHSLGGSLAINLASECKVNGLILLATPIRYPLYMRATVPVLRMLGVKLPYDQFHFREEKLYDHPAVKYIQQHYSPIYAKSLDDVFRSLNEAYHNLESIDIAVKMIYSKHDQTVPPNQVELIKNKLRSEPDITWLDNSDHVIVIDAERQIVRDETMKFCKEIFLKS